MLFSKKCTNSIIYACRVLFEAFSAFVRRHLAVWFGFVVSLEEMDDICEMPIECWLKERILEQIVFEHDAICDFNAVYNVT